MPELFHPVPVRLHVVGRPARPELLAAGGHHRVKAVATASAVNIGSAYRKGWYGTDSDSAAVPTSVRGPRRRRGRAVLYGEPQDWMKASRSALIVAAWVVGMPCGNPL
jgi:hypothetical protein